MVLSMAVLLLFAAACSPAEGNTQPVATGNPWENGGKQPVEYTYEEFLALTPGQQMAFQNSFGSLEAFDEWLQNAQGMVTEELPWENGGKQPSEFTYAEFEALSPAQQIAFQKSFQSEEAFDRWLKEARYAGVELPWENGGKQPDEYTYQEYEALTDLQKSAFREHFESLDAFNDWLLRVCVEQEELPWENGGKRPEAYTYEEFEKLTPGQQIAFQNSFQSADGFSQWVQRVKPQIEESGADKSWNGNGKRPEDYTYAEFAALSPAQQIAFQLSFSSAEAFDKWLQKAKPQDSEEQLPWENGGKQPKDYTYEEFEKLSPGLQIAFQNSFASLEEFDEWLQREKYTERSLPWENGGKQPSEYTYEEFVALSPAHQIAFQNSFGSIEAFDQWLTANTTQ